VTVCSVCSLLYPLCIPYDGKVILAKTNYSFEKRQRELEKKRKQEEKRLRKQDGKGASDGDEAESDLPDASPPGAEDPAAAAG
jgi:hypothetical protein